MFIDHIKKLQNYKVLKPLAFLGKKHIYNPYLKSKLVLYDFPPEVWIENTNCCNARCVMCPRDKHTRPLDFMDFSLFERLIKEIAKFKDMVKRVHMHNYGEPLLDRELPRRIKLAKDYGIRHVYFVTNASLLTPEKSSEIIKAGLDEFKISFYGTDKKTYNETMKGLDFDSSIQNVKNFIKIRKELNSVKPKVVIQYLPQETNKSKSEDFTNIFRPLLDKDIGDCLNIYSLHNFGDGREYHKSDRISGICNYPWRTMIILYDGRVVICCFDYNGVQVVGDVNKSNIEKIWNNVEYKQVRDDFKRLRYDKYSVCMKCDIIR